MLPLKVFDSERCWFKMIVKGRFWTIYLLLHTTQGVSRYTDFRPLISALNFKHASVRAQLGRCDCKNL